MMPCHLHKRKGLICWVHRGVPQLRMMSQAHGICSMNTLGDGGVDLRALGLLIVFTVIEGDAYFLIIFLELLFKRGSDRCDIAIVKLIRQNSDAKFVLARAGAKRKCQTQNCKSHKGAQKPFDLHKKISFDRFSKLFFTNTRDFMKKYNKFLANY